MKQEPSDMFDIDLMKHFYNPKYEKDEKVLNAWFLYVLKFLPIVSKQWRESVSNDKLKNEKSMFFFITISDEALVRWFITLWLPIIERRKKDNWKDEGKSTGKGPHDTKQNIKLYTMLHNDIEVARKDHQAAVRWNHLFWSEVKKKNLIVLEKKKTQSKYANVENSSNFMPLPDLNEDQAFLATLTVDSNYKENENENPEQDGKVSILMKDGEIVCTKHFGI